MIVSLFGKRREPRGSRHGARGKPAAPYASVAGFNEHTRSRRKDKSRPAKAPRTSTPPRPVPTRTDRPPRTRGERFRRLLLALFITFVAVPSLLFVLVYWSAEIPDPSSVQSNQIATILAADGTTVIAKVVPPDGNRVPVPLSDVPRPVRDAVLSAEDRNFYSNPGYSTSGFLRAVRDNIQGKDDAGGGSTITQQYVKNAFLGSERTLTRKMRELIIAAKMARQWSKDDILAAYLNTIYYGRGSYGIAAASKAYFNKPAPELTLAEGVVLASVIRTPSILDPENHLADLKARWRYVLDGMVEMGVLAPGIRDATVFPQILPINEISDVNEARGPEGLIRTQVLRELRASGISEHELSTGALQITTTIDANAQRAALGAIHDRLDPQPPELRGAVVSIDPRTGAVRAYYGGSDGIGFDFAQAPLQTGSAFKPFAVIAALQQNIPLTRILDSSPVTDHGTNITNVDGESCGKCSMAEALKRSLNTSFYRLTMSMSDGPKAIADAAHQAGIPAEIPGVAGKTLTEDGGRPLNGIVLGQYLVRPIDMASAYATIANSGVYQQPYFVQRVVAGDGRVLLDRGDQQVGKQLPPGQQRIPRGIADNTTEAMIPIAAYSNGHSLAGGRPSAAKTGTTQLGETEQNKDAWMIGFTPSLSTAVWVGTEQSEPIQTARGADIYGSGLPSDIWKQMMDGALDGTPIEEFPAAAPLGSQPDAGKPSSDSYDILNPPSGSTPAPVIVIPPAPQPPKEVEIFPGLSIPIPG
ncbi:penicillin-binding protein [Nocardia sp. NBC_00565]|uniref:transglycosylase domain-containing protein n=1 Tax=Nocardia sp. NBC_00565 TaxID=2975993 RepID=UPI002E81A6C4|nr:transglycosylase domain-containing protein [Nocardia sp. NBC_00565]WUC02259.1 penicillin-binding protein [Nocardia sp. NBC_00565]